MHAEREIWIGPVGPIPVYKEAPLPPGAAEGIARAQRLRTLDDHLVALRTDADHWTRREVVPRLAARGRDDERTVPALMAALLQDPSAAVRDAAAMALWSYADDERVADAFAHALGDGDADVRWSAAYGLVHGRRAD